MPETSEFAIFMFAVPDWTTEMPTYIADRLDLSFPYIKENVVVLDPASKLSVLF